MKYTGVYAELLQKRKLTLVRERELGPNRSILTVLVQDKHRLFYFQIHVMRDENGEITCW